MKKVRGAAIFVALIRKSLKSGSPIIMLVSYFVLFFELPAFAGLTGAGFGEWALAVLFPYLVGAIQILILVLWLVIHIWPQKSSNTILAIRTCVDLLFILFASFSLPFLANISNYIGYWEADVKKYYQFYSRGFILLIIPAFFIIYIVNSWFSTLTQKNRILVHIVFFLLCLFVILGLLMKYRC